MITREADYAIRAILELAPSVSGRSAAELARATQVPYAFLRRVLRKLTAAQLVQSTCGRAGGVRLARSAAAISLLDVAQAIDPSTITLNSCLRDGLSCARADHCAAHAALARVQQDLWQALAAISFDTLMQTPETKTNRRRKA